MITSFEFASLPVTRWKNGGGETREIVNIASPDAHFLWRASIASIQQDGPFSLFAGVDRVITLLAGSPFWLRGEERNHFLTLNSPWPFAGEWPLAAQGVSDCGLDFNIMTQRSRAASQVAVHTTTQHPAKEGIAYVLQGHWQMAASEYATGCGIWWQNEKPGDLVPQSEDAALLLAEIIRY